MMLMAKVLKHSLSDSMWHQLHTVNSTHLLTRAIAKQNRVTETIRVLPHSPPDPNPLCFPPTGPVLAMVCFTFCGQTSLTTTCSQIWLEFHILCQRTELKTPSLATETLSLQYPVSLICICKLKNGPNHLLSPWALGRMDESPLFALGSSWKLDKHTEEWRRMRKPIGVSFFKETSIQHLDSFSSLCELCFWAWPNDSHTTGTLRAPQTQLRARLASLVVTTLLLRTLTLNVPTSRECSF